MEINHIVSCTVRRSRTINAYRKPNYSFMIVCLPKNGITKEKTFSRVKKWSRFFQSLWRDGMSERKKELSEETDEEKVGEREFLLYDKRI